MSNKNETSMKLSFAERFAYGTGDYAVNLIYTAMSTFLLIYYTNVVGLGAGTAASIIAISKFLDGITDLVMGRIVDKTKSKYGKARPWILRLCVPFAISGVLLFSVPAGLEGMSQYIYIFVTYNLVNSIFLTGIVVPYSAMNSLMTTDQYERGLLGNFRMLLATAGSMTVNTFTLKLVLQFGNGDQYSQRGWTITMFIYALAVVAINIFMFSMCKERVVEPEVTKENEISMSETVKGLFTNKYWVLMAFGLFVMYFEMSVFFGSTVYYAQYTLGDVNQVGAIFNALTIFQIGTMCLTPFVMKFIGKHKAYMVGLAIAFVGFVVSGFAGVNPQMQIIASSIKGIGFGFMGAVGMGMLQDAITYGQWKNGFGSAGMGNAAASFCNKVGSGIGTAVLGWILAAGQFDAALPTQPDSALTSINVAFIWVPLAITVITFIVMTQFDLDKHYGKAIEDLENGRWKGSSNNN